MDSQEHDTTSTVLAHIRKLLVERDVAQMPEVGEQYPDLVFVHAYIAELRRAVEGISRGELSMEITQRGFLCGTLKGLQARLLHLVWQLQQVANGDLSCQIDFMGEFSSSFNVMVAQLDSALTALRRKEDELTKLTDTLRHEVRLKGEALTALSVSEANFRYQASHDALTGVFNRRSFFELAGDELGQAANAGVPCCVALLDLDDFKQFNDTFGHLDGDEALRHVTAVISQGLRKQDIIGRYGGEEFVCLFPELDVKRARIVLERLRARVERNLVHTGRGPVPITTSIGFVCVVPEALAQSPELDQKEGKNVSNSEFLEKVLRQVDQYLYKAKNNGKNRVEGGCYDVPSVYSCDLQAINAS
ncbi:diguanylate cyclase [Desulfovibrio sp. OttesenSCG-928-G15]|nr:diguanylate cyclase [Desulfovibrio sp. OttesenSCG-928-G15]